jgi:hypothetical protein
MGYQKAAKLKPGKNAALESKTTNAFLPPNA